MKSTWGEGYIRGYLNFQRLIRICYKKFPMIRGLVIFDESQQKFVSFPSYPPIQVKIFEWMRTVGSLIALVFCLYITTNKIISRKMESQMDVLNLVFYVCLCVILKEVLFCVATIWFTEQVGLFLTPQCFNS